MSSTGQCSEHIGGALGIYDVGIDEEDMDRRVYKQRGGEHYIYKDEGKWYVGHKIQRSIALSTTHLFDTESVWSCAYNHTSWINDDTIKFSPLTSDSCILSSRLRLSSSGPAAAAVSDYLGVFQRLPNMFSAGRPVWINAHGKVLMVPTNKNQLSVFMSKRVIIKSGSGLICPTDNKAENSLRIDHGWQYWNGSMWVSDGTIKVEIE